MKIGLRKLRPLVAIVGVLILCMAGFSAFSLVGAYRFHEREDATPKFSFAWKLDDKHKEEWCITINDVSLQRKPSRSLLWEQLAIDTYDDAGFITQRATGKVGIIEAGDRLCGLSNALWHYFVYLPTGHESAMISMKCVGEPAAGDCSPPEYRGPYPDMRSPWWQFWSPYWRSAVR